MKEDNVGLWVLCSGAILFFPSPSLFFFSPDLAYETRSRLLAIDVLEALVTL